MVKPRKKIQPPPEIEFVPDAWPRFEQFIREVVKAGPQHREVPKAKRQTGRARRAKSR